MTPDAHMVETLRLRTAALHRVSRSNDQLRRENDDLRARLAAAEAHQPSGATHNHYFLNQALCGEPSQTLRQAPGLPLCETCAAMYEQLPEDQP